MLQSIWCTLKNPKTNKSKLNGKKSDIIVSKMMNRSYCNKPSSRQTTSILLSDVKYNSTCIRLKSPFSLACGNCRPHLDPLANKRKKGKLSNRRHHTEAVNNTGAHIMDIIIILQKDKLLCIVKLEAIYKLSRIL